jgi:hypothetical protein
MMCERSTRLKQDDTAPVQSHAGELVSIAVKVHEASQRRMQLLDEAVSIIGRCDTMCEDLYPDIERSSDGGTEERDRHSVILNTCLILESNLKAQSEIVTRLSGEKLLDPGTVCTLQGIIDAGSRVVEEALGHARSLIGQGNRIIMLSSLILQRKLRQGRAVRSLAGLIESCRSDLELAVSSSTEDLERVRELADRIAGIGRLVENGNRAAVEALRDQSRAAWQAGYRIGSLAKAQFDIAEKVYHFTTDIHGELAAIRNMVEEKRNLFELSVQELTVLTVTISLKFKEYLGIKEVIRSLECEEGIRTPLCELVPYANIAFEDITDLASLNLDMTESSHRMNETGSRIMASTNEEMNLCGEVWNRVEEMTNQARYSVEVSEINLRNGRLLERELQQILDSMG